MLSLRRVLASAIVLGTALTGLGMLSGCQGGWSSSGYAGGPLADLQSVGLKELWQRRVTLAPGEAIKNVWRVGDSIYVSTSSARVVRITATGTKAWNVDLVEKNYRIFCPADTPSGKNVLILNQGEAFLVDKTTGDIKSRSRMEIAVNTDPIVVGNTFCVGGVNYFYSLYLDRLGGKKWVTAAPNDAFVAHPATEGEGEEKSAVLASEHGKLWRINLTTGDWMWKDRKTNGKVVGGPAVDARAAYVPCLDGNVYAFEMNTGAQLWNTPLHGVLDKDLALTRSEVLVPTGSNVMYCLSTSKGEKRWEAPGVKDIGTIAGDRVWVMDSVGTLKALSLDTGEELASAAMGDARIVRNTVDRNVIVVSKGGVVGMYAAK
jgi:outer membrane protein assembly factor BamB